MSRICPWLRYNYVDLPAVRKSCQAGAGRQTSPPKVTLTPLQPPPPRMEAPPVGILSGISYVSGIDYYKGICEQYAELVGKRLLMPPNPLLFLASVDWCVMFPLAPPPPPPLRRPLLRPSAPQLPAQLTCACFPTATRTRRC